MSYSYGSQSPPPKVETERISANGREISQVSISLVAFELTKRRTRRDFVHFFRDFNTSRTRVRMTQSDANRSPCVKFPDHQGKYREFSRFRLPWRRVACEKALSSLGISSEFPTQPNREFFWWNREFFRRNREFDPQNRESLLPASP